MSFKKCLINTYKYQISLQVLLKIDFARPHDYIEKKNFKTDSFIEKVFHLKPFVKTYMKKMFFS